MSTLHLEQLFCGPMGNCLYMLADPAAKKAFIIDPAFEPLLLHRTATDAGYEVLGVLLTHAHPDHVGGEIFGMNIPGLRELCAEVDLPVHLHPAEHEYMLRQTGIEASRVSPLADEQRIKLGTLEVRVLHTPGHSPGSVGFLVDGHLVSGDTLFVRAVGRVDLPGSNADDLFHSLQRLSQLPPETRVYPGHNYGPAPSSTIGEEVRLNPYLRPNTLEQWRMMMGM